METVKIKDLLDILKQDNIMIYKAKLPYKIGGACKPDGDEYIILLNTHGKNKPVTSLLHELIHIYHNDFKSKNTLNFIEHRAHLQTKIVRKNLDNKSRRILNALINTKEVIYG